MLNDFKAFINKGNVVDLAVAVIIGAAFGRIVTSLTDDLIMPVIGYVTGGLDFSSHFLRLGAIPADFKGSVTSYADLKSAGVPLIGFGQFITVAVNFLIVAFIVFLLVRAIQRVEHKKDETPAAPPAPPEDVVLLREILAELKKKG
ncbi:large conductance mechanosensitive channel protein MscL [Rhizorhabdus dicambivorans]|uniref:Large-conductance mechanosensitive channel n=1 Tax=Rhizorhabdus dicambivorans TaxID=1850238 RepID=A0A2A4FX03_9SPHN|nr:large conductance mechanosensitive channel protein MscL [Rhizorhabdus dicambivorans]ATE66885.1 large conductance mechanosensitive channel protein MscL [Rhizorhabdus dicambivorans]PCE42246.1 large conductance mechanosensitive channel protein MscL [Rhizorhabdus dicambivorans]